MEANCFSIVERTVVVYPSPNGELEVEEKNLIESSSAEMSVNDFVKYLKEYPFKIWIGYFVSEKESVRIEKFGNSIKILFLSNIPEYQKYIPDPKEWEE